MIVSNKINQKEIIMNLPDYFLSFKQYQPFYVAAQEMSDYVDFSLNRIRKSRGSIYSIQSKA